MKTQDNGIKISLEDCFRYGINESHSLQLGTEENSLQLGSEALEHSLQLGSEALDHSLQLGSESLDHSLQLRSEALDGCPPKAKIAKITSIVDASTQTTSTGPVRLNSGHIYIFNLVESCYSEKSTQTFIQIPVLGK